MPGVVTSMTGSGAATADGAAGRFAVEVRAVNHRFLKTTVRTSASLAGADAQLEERVRRRVHRGHVTLHVRHRAPPEATAVSIDEDAFGLAAGRLQALARAHGLREPSVGDVLRLPGLGAEPSAADRDALLPPALEAVDRALDELVAARATEGAMLAEEIGSILGRVGTAAEAIGGAAAALPAAVQARLQDRLEELLRGSGVAPDGEAIAREVALLADRADIREEVARLAAHVAHARALLAEGGPLGRRLEFLVQEMHREASTIGSKVADAAVARQVVDLKADVERLREQVQNVE